MSIAQVREALEAGKEGMDDYYRTIPEGLADIAKIDAALAWLDALPDTEAIWLVYSREHNAFWRANSCGYTNLPEEAGRYTRADAEACCSRRSKLHDDDPPEVMVVAPEAADRLQLLVAKETA